MSCTLSSLISTISLHVDWPCGPLLVLGLCGDLEIHPESCFVLVNWSCAFAWGVMGTLTRYLTSPFIPMNGLGFESKCMHMRVRLGGYGRTHPLINKPFYSNGLVVGILTVLADRSCDPCSWVACCSP
ncbi:unnamed protein product [Closterium sp. NIES-54]